MSGFRPLSYTSIQEAVLNESVFSNSVCSEWGNTLGSSRCLPNMIPFSLSSGDDVNQTEKF